MQELDETWPVCLRSVFRHDHAGTEAIIHADLDLTNGGAIGQEGGAVGLERRVSSKGQVIVLGLGEPVLSEIEFGAVAERPANAGVAWRAEACGNDTNSGIIC